MMTKALFYPFITLFAMMLFATLGMAAHHGGPKVYFIGLEDGQTVSSPLTVRFGLAGYGVAPAGVDKPQTGHHHLLIDTALSEDEMQYPIPSDDKHRHFGGGQTQVTVDLEPGEHTLQLVLGDASHVPLGPEFMSARIIVTVR